MKKNKFILFLIFVLNAHANLCETMPEGEFNCISSDNEEWVVTISSSLNADRAKAISISPRGSGDTFYDRLPIHWPGFITPHNFNENDFKRVGSGIVDSWGSDSAYSGGYTEFQKVSCKDDKVIIKTKKEFQTGKVSRNKIIYKFKNGTLTSKVKDGLFSSHGFQCENIN